MKSFVAYIVVFLGAGAGGALRHAVNVIATRAARPDFPIATLAVNVLGSFAAGVLASYLAPRGDDGATMRLFALTGVLGGFTTFSAFSIELTRFMERGATVNAFVYALGSVVLSVAAVFAGIWIARP